MNLKLLILLCLSSVIIAQQSGKITGKVIDKSSGEALPGVNIILIDTDFGTATDAEGNFEIGGLTPGRYSLKASFVGYTSVVKSDILVNTARPAFTEIELSASAIEIEGVTVQADYFDNIPTEVVSTKSFSYEEIRRSPGGFEDVIRALSVLPGVARQSAGRNDLVVRGGAPSENLYMVDGYVIPNINHFGTQGSTGGPLSYINLDFVKGTTFSTGGFSALYGDKLSSVLSIDLRKGREDRIGGKGTVSASLFGLNLEGPSGDNGNFIFSLRRSYLDFIFNAAGFNFVPEYYDLLGKYDYRIDEQNTLSFMFIGALDRVKFNNNDEEDIYDNARILGNNQNQFVTGLTWKHLFKKGFYSLRVSQNYVDYENFQKDTLRQPIFKNNSVEAETELKADLVYAIAKNSEINVGVSTKLINFDADIYFPDNFVTTFGETLPVNSAETNTMFNKSAVYAQYSALYFSKLRMNAGLRLDYFDGIKNKFYVSPRFSLAYSLTPLLKITGSAGIYYQSPAYIWLTSFEQNKDLDAIKVDQYVTGIEYMLRADTRVKLEGFYKNYSNYPASTIRPYLVLSNTGGGYGGAVSNFESFGLDPLVSEGTGYARGVEFSVQKKSSEIPHYAIMSVTFSESMYEGLDGVERPGAFDQKWIFSLSGGYIFNEKWELSFKFRLATGSPYTNFQPDGTQLVSDYLTQRYDTQHSLDLRVDRRWNLDKWAIITYIDIQNIYNNKSGSNIRFDYREMKTENEQNIGLLPSIGISVEF